jgi:hypothetical protein
MTNRLTTADAEAVFRVGMIVGAFFAAAICMLLHWASKPRD